MADLRDAFRALRATPLITAVAIVSLALGIGANTAIFSILDTLLLRAALPSQPRAPTTGALLEGRAGASYTLLHDALVWPSPARLAGYLCPCVGSFACFS